MEYDWIKLGTQVRIGAGEEEDEGTVVEVLDEDTVRVHWRGCDEIYEEVKQDLFPL